MKKLYIILSGLFVFIAVCAAVAEPAGALSSRCRILKESLYDIPKSDKDDVYLKEMKERLIKVINTLAKEGKITKSQARKAIKIINRSKTKIEFSKLPPEVQKALREHHRKQRNPLEGLTSEQKARISRALLESRNKAIALLVQKGVITEKQVEAYKKSGIGSVQLTDEQKTALKDALLQAHREAINALVSEGVLTKEQAEKILNRKKETPPPICRKCE
jgi:polyhydroxyalkanoate synthesis regulator phasin